MKTILLLLLLTSSLMAQTPKAIIQLSNGQFINNAPSGRDWTTWDVKGVTTYDGTDTLRVDNGDLTRIAYYGKWSHAEAGCFCSYSNTATDSIVFLFTDANYFQWRGELMAHHGIADIYWDNKYVGQVDTYDTRNLSNTRNFQAENLETSKVYKFKLVVTGKKNTLSTGTYIVNHGFMIYKNAVAPEPPPTPTPSGGVITITRSGRFKVYLDGVLLEGEHNEYEKAIERAVNVKAQNKTKEVRVVSPDRIITIQ